MNTKEARITLKLLKEHVEIVENTINKYYEHDKPDLEPGIWKNFSNYRRRFDKDLFELGENIEQLGKRLQEESKEEKRNK